MRAFMLVDRDTTFSDSVYPMICLRSLNTDLYHNLESAMKDLDKTQIVLEFEFLHNCEILKALSDAAKGDGIPPFCVKYIDTYTKKTLGSE